MPLPQKAKASPPVIAKLNEVRVVRVLGAKRWSLFSTAQYSQRLQFSSDMCYEREPLLR